KSIDRPIDITCSDAYGPTSAVYAARQHQRRQRIYVAGGFMSRTASVRFFTAALALLSCTAASAQGTSAASISGLVTDSSGAVLPGVTVEASSPVLIEKVRTAVTDERGEYRIVELRPGTYTVTFTLTGFATFKREGLELPPSFNATITVQLRIGAIEESV